MYNCYDHGWSSHHSMCPTCLSGNITTSSSSTVHVLNEETQMYDRLVLSKGGRLLVKCPKCMKEGVME